MVPPIPRTAIAGHVATSISAALTSKILRIQQSMPDSNALNPVSGKTIQTKYAGSVQLGPYTRSLVSNTRHPDKPANHTNRDCWVFKQAGKLIAENNDKGLHSDDEEETRPPNNR